jgi:hypothetical protein
LLVPAICIGADAQKTASPVTSPAPVSSPVIPVPDVAKRAMEVSNALRTFSIKPASSPEIETIRKQLPGVNRDIEQQVAATRRIILEEASLETLQSQQQLWESLQHETAGRLYDAVHAAGMTFPFPSARFAYCRIPGPLRLNSRHTAMMAEATGGR